MGWNGIGWFVAVCLGAAGTAVTFLYPAYREFGYFLLGIAALCFCAAVWGALRLGWPHLRALHTRIGTAKTMLLVGIVGTWVFVTFTFGVVSWMIAYPPATAQAAAPIDDGPLRWFSNLEMEGGPRLGRPVFSLTFHGGNGSQKEVSLKSASIVSAINGKKIDLEILAKDAAEKTELTPIDKINLIPPGAPVDLVAKFGDPDPGAPGKILGLDAKTFLETWSKFYFNVSDDSKTYRLPYNEGHLMGFFPGMVGPHVTKR